MPAACTADDGPVHGARQPRADAVDAGSADVRAQDPLQHHVARARRVDRRRAAAQGAALQHGPVPRHGPSACERELAAVDGEAVVQQGHARTRRAVAEHAQQPN